MVKSFVTEIRDFFSLREIMEDLEERIAQYTMVKEEYSQQLGAYMRKSEESYKDEQWFKNLSLDKIKGGERGGKKEGKKKGGKKKGEKPSSCWIPYMGLSLSSTDQGEMELIFEAIEEFVRKIDRLVEAKKVLEELSKVGLGENLRYRVYIKDGVPEKIVLRPREAAAKFALNMVFSTVR